MESKKINVHYQNVWSIQMKEKLKGNEIWGREYIFLCLKEVQESVLEKIIDEITMERVISGVF